MPAMADKRVIVCNVGRASSAVKKGARAYLRFTTGDIRCAILARSRGGRYIKIWGSRKELAPFRVATIPAEHPMYKMLNDYGKHAEVVAGNLNCDAGCDE